MSYILHLCGWYPSRVDQFNGDFVQRHVRAIALTIPSVVLFAIKDDSLSKGALVCDRQHSGNLDEWIYYYPKHKLLDTALSQLYYLHILKKAIRAITAQYGKPAGIHLHVVWKAGIWALRLKKWRVPLVITEHSTAYLPEAVPNLQTASYLKRRVFEKVYSQAKFLAPVSAHLGNAIQSGFGRLPSLVVPNAVDTDLFFPGNGAESKASYNIIHVSTMNYQKNIDGVLRVIDTIIESFPLVRFTMVGPMSTALEQWWNDSVLRKKLVHFTGWQPYNSVAQLMKEADLLFLFSRYENLPCVLLEAFCTGLPVVSTKVGGIAEIVDQENGILVKEGDEQALANALAKIFTGEIVFDRKKIADDAREKYSYQTIGRMFALAYTMAGISMDNTASDYKD